MLSAAKHLKSCPTKALRSRQPPTSATLLRRRSEWQGKAGTGSPRRFSPARAALSGQQHRRPGCIHQ